MVKRCRRCQIETERYASGRCKPCSKSASAAWYMANPDRAKATAAAWQAANPIRNKANMDAWRAANLDKNRASAAAWAKANPEKVRARNAAWYAANRCGEKARTDAWRAANLDRNKASAAAWAKANSESRRIHRQNREARKRENGGTLSKGLARRLFVLQRGKCPCCNLPLGTDYHLDHIIPISMGGPNIDANIQLLRQSCNKQKHAKHTVEFMQQRGFLL